MHLQTASANQQLDMLTTMSRLLPLMCHLTYPVPSQQTGLTPAPGTRANVVRIGPDKKAPPPDDTERGKPAKVTKVLKSEVVVMSDTASLMTSPAVRAPTGTGALAGLAASAVPAQGQFHAMQQPIICYGSHLQYGLGVASPMTAPGYTYGFPMPTSGVMPPPGFQFPGAGFQAGPGPHPGHPASLDQQDYLEGAPRPSHSEKNPHTGEANRALTVDEGEDFIPIDSDGEDGSDCEIVEVVDPPLAAMPVKTSKTKQKPIDKAMQQATVKVSATHVDEILGTVSSSDGGDADTTPSTTPVKDKKARKSRKKKSSKDSAGDAPPLSKEVKAAERKEAAWKAQIKEEGKVKAMQRDYPIIKILRAGLGLLFNEVNQYDMTGHMQRINAWRQSHLGEADWHGMFIMLTTSARAAYIRDLNNPGLKLDSKTRTNYQNAISQINKFTQTTPMKRSRQLAGAPFVYITHLAQMFMDEKGLQMRKPTGMNIHGVTFGLIRLHDKDVICRHQYRNVIVGGKCPICTYCTDNHDSVNNHIRMHWRMGLVCAFCEYVDITMNGMLGHGQAIHGIEYLKK